MPLLVVLGLLVGCSDGSALQDGGVAGLLVTDGASAVVTSPFGATGTVVDVTGGASVTRVRSVHNGGRRDLTVEWVAGYRPSDPAPPADDRVVLERGEGCRLVTDRVDAVVLSGRPEGDELPERADAEPFDGDLVVPAAATLVLWVDATWLDDGRGCQDLGSASPGPVRLDARRGGTELSFPTSSGAATEGLTFVRGLDAYLAGSVTVDRHPDPALDVAAEREEG